MPAPTGLGAQQQIAILAAAKQTLQPLSKTHWFLLFMGLLAARALTDAFGKFTRLHLSWYIQMMAMGGGTYERSVKAMTKHKLVEIVSKPQFECAEYTISRRGVLALAKIDRLSNSVNTNPFEIFRP